eukprot:5802156-Karenia_brevis.AAC.1
MSGARSATILSPMPSCTKIKFDSSRLGQITKQRRMKSQVIVQHSLSTSQRTTLPSLTQWTTQMIPEM